MAATTPPRTAALTEVDTHAFRSIAGRFASGVTVITTSLADEPFGTTVSAVSSLSLDPPMMLVCLNRASNTHDAVRAAGRFAINILAEGQEPLAFRFAKSGTDKFDGVHYALAEGGTPILEGTVASILCRTTEVATGGTHTVFLAEVEGAAVAEVQPLTYYRGTFGRLERGQEHAAYRGLRSWILSRAVAPGEGIDPEAVAADLNADVEHVHHALLRLASESLVERSGREDYVVAPITADLAVSLIDARTAILVGVLERQTGAAGPTALAAIRTTADRMHAAHAGASITDYLEAVDEFQRAIIDLSGSLPIANAFSRLGLPALFSRTLPDAAWAERMEHAHLRAVADAVLHGDATAAATAAHTHGEHVKALATALIADAGGSV